MRKIREVLRLRYEVGLSARQIAASVQIARSSVGEYERRLAAAGLSWPLPEGLSDTALEQRLFPPPPPVPTDARPIPNWSVLHEELRRPGVTLMLLWQEYRAAHPQGFAYSSFCEHYRVWAGKLDLVMRQTHRAGEKLFVDYAGQTVEIIDHATGEVRAAQIFVAVLGASSYTYAEATYTQSLPDWIVLPQQTFWANTHATWGLAGSAIQAPLIRLAGMLLLLCSTFLALAAIATKRKTFAQNLFPTTGNSANSTTAFSFANGWSRLLLAGFSVSR